MEYSEYQMLPCLLQQDHFFLFAWQLIVTHKFCLLNCLIFVEHEFPSLLTLSDFDVCVKVMQKNVNVRKSINMYVQEKNIRTTLKLEILKRGLLQMPFVFWKQLYVLWLEYNFYWVLKEQVLSISILFVSNSLEALQGKNNNKMFRCKFEEYTKQSSYFQHLDVFLYLTLAVIYHFDCNTGSC